MSYTLLTLPMKILTLLRHQPLNDGYFTATLLAMDTAWFQRVCIGTSRELQLITSYPVPPHTPNHTRSSLSRDVTVPIKPSSRSTVVLQEAYSLEELETCVQLTRLLTSVHGPAQVLRTHVAASQAQWRGFCSQDHQTLQVPKKKTS